MSLPHAPWIFRLGGTLLHFLWQGTLLALLLGGMLWMLQDRSPRLRYALACLTLLGTFLAPILTWITLGVAPALPTTATAMPPHGSGPVAVAGAPGTGAFLGLGWMPLAVGGWLLGVLLLSLRLTGSWAWLQWLRHRSDTYAAPDPIQLRLLHVCRRMGLASNLRLLVCPRVPGPIVMGWLRPVVLLPPAALAGLTVEQLELLLAHEVAHVLRHDFALNVLQSCVEVLLFYHPAVWWISSRIREERELCCDDLAVSASGDALGYAAALTRLEVLNLQSPHPSPTPSRLALAASGGSFMHRIQRLLAPSAPLPLAPRAGLLLLALGGAVALQARIHAPTRTAGQAASVPAPAPRRLTIDLKQADLVQFLRLLADTAKVNLVVAPEVQGTQDFTFVDTPWNEVLEASLKPGGYAWELRNGVIFVARARRLQNQKRLTAGLFRLGESSMDYSGNKITLDLHEVPMADLLHRVAAEGGIRLEVDPAVVGIYNYHFQDTPWDQVLDVVLMNASLAWEIRDGVLIIHAPKA